MPDRPCGLGHAPQHQAHRLEDALGLLDVGALELEPTGEGAVKIINIGPTEEATECDTTG